LVLFFYLLCLAFQELAYLLVFLVNCFRRGFSFSLQFFFLLRSPHNVAILTTQKFVSSASQAFSTGQVSPLPPLFHHRRPVCLSVTGLIPLVPGDPSTPGVCPLFCFFFPNHFPSLPFQFCFAPSNFFFSRPTFSWVCHRFPPFFFTFFSFLHSHPPWFS